MKIFINDRPFQIEEYSENLNLTDFNVLLYGNDEIISTRLKGKVALLKATSIQIERILRLLEFKKLKKMTSVHIYVQDYKTMKQFIKDQFTIIKASGGLVRKAEKVLMIYRLKKWDLPKGKLKKGEDALKGAKREVEEECNIRVEVKDKLCSTWHTYIRKDKRILKKTNWYVMNCLDDSTMKPQLEEFIEDVKWMKKEDAIKLAEDSYLSINEVVQTYYREIESLQSIR